MIFRGSIHEVKALPTARGHEQQGRRYGVVIQTGRFASSLTTIAMTSTRAGPAVYRPEIRLNGVSTRILTDQIFSLADSRLGAFVGALEPDERSDLDRALMLKLGLV